MICPYLSCHVFGKTAGNNDDVFSKVGHLFDTQVHHAAKGDLKQ